MGVHPIPKTIGASELRDNQAEVLDHIAEGPVLVARHNRAAAVLVDVETWNRVLEELADLQDACVAMERLRAARQDPDRLRPLEDVEKDLDA
jgi:prevent-host-death family protein